MEQASAHRGDGAIDDVVEGTTLFCLSTEQFKIADGEAIEPHIFLFFDTAEVLYMACLQVLRHIQIHQYASCCGDACRHVVESEALERGDAPEFL